MWSNVTTKKKNSKIKRELFSGYLKKDQKR